MSDERRVKRPMRLLICGAGAMGSLFGALLTLAGQEVWLLSHWQAHIRRVRREGLRLHPLNGPPRIVPLQILSYEEPLPDGMDVIFVSVKSHQTRAAVNHAARALAADGVVITMQNGIGNREVLAEVVGEDRAMVGVTSHGATLLRLGEVRHAGAGPTHLSAHPDPDAAARIAAMLGAAGVETTVEREIEAVIWRKLLVNCGINALTALLGVPNGVLADEPHAETLLRESVQEAAAVAHALGIDLGEGAPVERALAVARATSSNISSMLSDVRRRVPTEIDVINGAVVREGARVGVPTPVNRALTLLVQATERTYGDRL